VPVARRRPRRAARRSCWLWSSSARERPSRRSARGGQRRPTRCSNGPPPRSPLSLSSRWSSPPVAACCRSPSLLWPLLGPLLDRSWTLPCRRRAPARALLWSPRRGGVWAGAPAAARLHRPGHERRVAERPLQDHPRRRGGPLDRAQGEPRVGYQVTAWARGVLTAVGGGSPTPREGEPTADARPQTVYAE